MKRDQVEELIYGGATSRRFTQDSPVLIDVWIAYAERDEDPAADPVLTGPGENRPLPLLLTPFQDPKSENPAGRLSVLLRMRLEADRKLRGTTKRSSANIGYNQSTVVADLWFDELVRVVLPLSHWWTQRICPPDIVAAPSRKKSKKAPSAEKPFNLLDQLETPAGRSRLVDALRASGPHPGPRLPVKSIALSGDTDSTPAAATTSSRVPQDVLWMVRVVGSIAAEKKRIKPQRARTRKNGAGQAKLAQPIRPEDIVDALADLLKGVTSAACEARVYSVCCNRLAWSTVARSRVSVKADAAYRLFELSCAELSWAIIDSGIDASHPAFRRRDKDGTMPPLPPDGSVTNTRVLATYDFTLVRYLLSAEEPDLMVGDDAKRYAAFKKRLKTDKSLNAEYKHLKQSLLSGKNVDWEMLTPFVRIPHDAGYQKPQYEHGTHVAGILAGDWNRKDGDMRSVEDGGDARSAQDAEADPADYPFPDELVGLCKDLNVYDLRVLDDAGRGDEFNVIAALQFVRHLRHHRSYQPIHGVNLSLSIRHDVANYACGRTPVCDECERLVGAGVVVVAAAGNEGYKHYTTNEDRYDGYQDMSITDPGNADAVITVGSTHRFQPHTYGVSYFSSRGPTGDGRAKPDLVAPGEKIDGPIPGGNRKPLDGTSMAAPHVSGAAALLIARHRELAGQPVRVKQILCASATDLGRERYFQGHGMVDVLRALQSV